MVERARSLPKVPSFPNSLVLGSPAKVVKDLGPESADNNHKWAEKYVKVAARYTERVINPGFNM